MIFGPELRRRLMVKQLSNDKLFLEYQPELLLRIHNQLNLKNDIALLAKFKAFLDDSRPSPSLAREFISGYHQRSLSTQARYAATIKGFMGCLACASMVYLRFTSKHHAVLAVFHCTISNTLYYGVGLQ